MFDDDRAKLPLFYRRRAGPHGECDEVSVGPSAVCIFRWITVLLIVLLLALAGASPSVLLRLLLKAWL